MREVAIYAIIKHACVQCSCPEMAAKDRIKVVFSDRLTSSLALALYDPETEVGEITLSSIFWRHLSAFQKIELVIHETCHILADYIFGDTKPHGQQWKLLMMCAGIAKPNACLEVDI